MNGYLLKLLVRDRIGELLRGPEAERQARGAQDGKPLRAWRLPELIQIQKLPRVTWAAAALPVVWFTQGSTFVALKVGVASVPPFLLSGTRFVLVGLLLLTWAAWRAGWRIHIERRDVMLAAGTGLGLFLAGQGSASWSSQFLAPGVVAVLTSTIPLWAALIGLVAFRTGLGKLGSVGLLAGFAGVAFLAWPGAGTIVAAGPALLVVAGAGCWGAAVVVVSRSGIGRRPALITSIQALLGGGLQIVLGLATGEADHVQLGAAVAAIPAFAYLVVVSSLIGFPLLTWLLSEVRVDIANTASYVAPVIALALGWLLLAERITPRTLGGVAVILVGVAAMVWSARPRQAAETELEPTVEFEELAA